MATTFLPVLFGLPESRLPSRALLALPVKNCGLALYDSRATTARNFDNSQQITALLVKSLLRPRCKFNLNAYQSTARATRQAGSVLRSVEYEASLGGILTTHIPAERRTI